MVCFLNTILTSTAQSTPLSSGQGPLLRSPRLTLAGRQNVLWGRQKAHSSGTRQRKGTRTCGGRGWSRCRSPIRQGCRTSQQTRVQRPGLGHGRGTPGWTSSLPTPRSPVLIPLCPVRPHTHPGPQGRMAQASTWSPAQAQSPKCPPPKGQPGLGRSSPDRGF